MSDLERDLAELEAADPAVRQAAERLDDMTRSILSTSAQLRQVQQALAASQADLTETERQREDLRRRLNLQSANWCEAMKERDLARAELANAAHTGWIVARDGGRNCERCELEIRRGEAYEEQPGTGGLLVHIHCRAERDCSGGCHIVDCAVCRQPIRCDQPREPMPGAKGFYQHAGACPDSEGATA